MTESPKNVLYYGDNLDVLRRHVKDDTVDLVYLDPPFNSNANYNVLFAEKDGSKAASQIQAFSDTWTWTQESEAIFAEIVTAGGRVADCLRAFRMFLGECDMLAYLVMMAPRLVELRRAMKQTGSIYLHCDPTASHYLKLLMDAVFGPQNFRNEIVWKRTSAHSSAKRCGPVHDILLFYILRPMAALGINRFKPMMKITFHNSMCTLTPMAAMVEGTTSLGPVSGMAKPVSRGAARDVTAKGRTGWSLLPN